MGDSPPQRREAAKNREENSMSDYLTETLAKYDLEEVEISPAFTPDDVKRVDKGFLFLMASWSSPSLRSFQTFCQILNEFDTSNIRLIICDVDDSPDLYDVPELVGKIQGYGELVYIVDGRIEKVFHHMQTHDELMAFFPQVMPRNS